MKNLALISITLLTIASASFLSGCNPLVKPFHPADTNSNLHLVRFSSEGPAIIVIPLGEEVSYRWTIKNSADGAITVRITITQITKEPAIDGMSNTVLQYNDEYEFHLAKDEEQDLTITWNQQDDSGAQVDPGEYRLEYICSAWKTSQAPEESCQTFEDTLANIIVKEPTSTVSGESENQPITSPGEPVEVHPQPNAGDIRYYTTISATLPKGYHLLEMNIAPFVDLAHISEDSQSAEGTKYVAFPSSVLDYETSYHVIIKYADSSGSPHEYFWRFTTENYGSIGPEPAPEPEGNDVSIDTPISIYFHRFSGFRGAPTRQEWAEIAELITIPLVTIGQVTLEETGLSSVLITFYPKEPLKANTTYTAIYTTEPKLSCYVWNFTTGQ